MTSQAQKPNFPQNYGIYTLSHHLCCTKTKSVFLTIKKKKDVKNKKVKQMFATKNCVQNSKIHPKFLDGMTTDGELSFSPRGRHLSCHRRAGVIIDRTRVIIDTQVGKKHPKR